MIDWIKAIIPCAHTEEICGNQVVSFDHSTGEIEWQIRKRLPVEGSHSSTVQVKTHDVGYLLIDGNPAKFLQGHNIFGSNDLIGLCYAFFIRVCEALDLRPSAEDKEKWRKGEYELKRVDFAESFQLDSQADVAAWLRAAIPAVRGKHQKASAYDGETIYLGQNSRRIALKVYNKWRELQKHSLPQTIPYRKELELYASRLLRVEVRLLGMELKRRGLNQAHNWGWPGTGSGILKERIGLIILSEKLRLTTKENAELPPRLVAVYKLWLNGEDLRGLYPKSTYYRYRSELLKHGIDITTPQPKKAQVVPLIKYLTAEHVPGIPNWAVGTELYYEPASKQKSYKHIKIVKS